MAPERERQYLVLFEVASSRAPDPAPTEPARPKKGASRRSDKRPPPHDSRDQYIEQLQQELDALRAYQQTLIEQFESSQEELTSANEELQATNEEFQSTNEELETAKEELQSANEELTTINDELQSRNAELVSVNEKLARGEDRFRLMVEVVKDYAIYMLDPDGRITSWNEGARRLKGYEASEILGEHYSRFFLPQDIADRAPEIELEQARIEGRFEAEGWRLRKDGTRLWANVVVTRINDSRGTLIGFTKVTRDLTERRKAEEALRQANEGLEARVRDRTRELIQALKVRDDFLSIASHELRTPLTGLKLQLQLARRNVDPARGMTLSADKAATAFDRALRQEKALEELVDDLLDISRIQTGKLLLEPKDVDVGKLVEEVVARFADQLAQAKSQLVLQLAPGLTARWDDRRVAQVLVNLLSNALKYAPGAPIQVSVTRDGERARLVVQDAGPGISKERQGAVFERFERAGASPNVGGLGLGLFIARRIVEAHRGTIRLESEPGQGARFIVELPLTLTDSELALGEVQGG
jgi:PAS domain S-box-containing protein